MKKYKLRKNVCEFSFEKNYQISTYKGLCFKKIFLKTIYLSTVRGLHYHKICVQFQQNIPIIYRKENWFVLGIRLTRITWSQPSLSDSLNCVDAGVT